MGDVYIRCTECLASSWVDVLGPEGLARRVGCESCGHEHTLHPIERLGPSVRDHYRRVLSFARERDYDLATAYSVLLGFMSPTQAEVLRHSRPTAPQAPAPVEVAAEEAVASATVSPSTLPLVPDFDLGFAKAIAAGRMTVQQAMVRGDRTAFAQGLMRRHRLPEDLALQVTDCKVDLRAALREVDERRHRQHAHPPPRASRGRSRLRAIVLLGAGVLALVPLARGVWRQELTVERQPVLAPPGSDALRSATPARTAEVGVQLPPATEIAKNELGHLTQVVGPDPASVLRAFCTASPSILGLEPLEIRPTTPPFRSARLGLFRDPAALEATWAIRIQQDARTRRWVAGHGSQRIPVVKAPAPTAAR